MRRATRPRPLDVYKKIPVLRRIEDSVVDEFGANQVVTAADLEREVAAAPVTRAKKLNIPIPVGDVVADYENRTRGGYAPPVSYIRQVFEIQS